MTGAGCGKGSRFGVSAWKEEYSLDVRSLLAIPACSGLQSPRCGRKNKKGNCAGVEREAVSRSERTWVVKHRLRAPNPGSRRKIAVTKISRYSS